MKWKVKKLNEVADFTLGKMLDQKKNKGELLPYLANINVRWGEFDFSNLRMMRFEQCEVERFGLKFGDILMCEGGEPGRCAIWKNDRSGIMIQKALHRIRTHDLLNNNFLYYTFLNKGRSGEFSQFFTGSTIKHLPKQQLSKINIRFPNLLVQNNIASILSTYDDLIGNNRRRIELLETSARLLYKEWFVNFRFPGHENVKIIDGVPEGWSFQSINEIAKTVGGGTPSTKIKEYWEGGDNVWFSPTDLTKNNCIVLLNSAKKITDLGMKMSSAKLLPPKTILMTSRASIGYFGVFEGLAATNQGFISLIPHDEIARWYILHNLKSRVDEIVGLAGGATFKEINKTTFRAMRLLIPSEILLKKFDEYYSDIYQQTLLIKKKVDKLSQARDLLLPRLMSGELSV